MGEKILYLRAIYCFFFKLNFRYPVGLTCREWTNESADLFIAGINCNRKPETSRLVEVRYIQQPKAGNFQADGFKTIQQGWKLPGWQN